MTALSAKALSAGLWGTGGAFVRLFLQFGTQILLARILGPEQYGIFAIAMVVVTFSHLFSDLGFAYSLVQRERVTDLDIRYVFTWQVILGLTISSIVLLAGEAIAAYLSDPRAGHVIQALSIISLLTAMAAPALNLLRRNLDFRKLLVAQILAFVGGYVCVGIPLALSGAEVWALVASYITQSFLFLLLIYNATRHPLKLKLRHEQSKAFSGFGILLFLTNTTNWFILNVDRIIIGNLIHVRELGLYTTTHNILYTPSAAILDVVQPVFFSSSSRISDDQKRISLTYCALLAAVCLYMLPAFAAVATVAETFILALYGDSWKDAAELVTPLALSMPLFFIWGLTTPMLWTGGHTQGGHAAMEFKTQLPLACIWAAACWLAAQHSVQAVAWSVFGLCLMRCILIIGMTSRRLKMDLNLILRAMAGGVVCSLFVAFAAATMDQVAASLAPIIRLLIVAIAAGAALLLALYTFPRLITAELNQLNRRVIVKLPASLRRPLAFLGRES